MNRRASVSGTAAALVAPACLGVLLLLSSLFFLSEACAEQSAWRPRTVLALYKSSEGQTPQRNEIRRMLEFPLNDLGLVVRYHDICQGLPDEALLRDCLGVVTWFTTPEMPGALAYCDWLIRQMETGRKVVIFGSFGAFTEQATGEEVDGREVDRVYHVLGIGVDPFRPSGHRPDVAIVSADPLLVGFERPIRREEMTFYQRVYSLYPDSRSFLTVRLRDVPESDSHPIVVTRTGGMALEYLCWIDPLTQIHYWHLNPWAFLEAALGLEGMPRMDVSVLNGRRLWFMHVDGDGFTTPSNVWRGYACADVFEREILRRYGLPVTASVIVAEIDPSARGSPSAISAAQRLFARPLVEPASHTFSHPHDWAKGVTDLEVPGYRFNLQRELVDSVAYVQQRLVPEGRAVRLLQASGACNVPAEGVRMLAERGVRVLNIGYHARYDEATPGLSGLTPVTAPADGVVQYSHRAANDFYMTDNWTRPDGFRDIVETFRRTGSPRPLMPLNVYCHWYSAQTIESLSALRSVIDWCVKEPIAPIWAGTYLDIVDGFRAARIAKNGERSWIVESNGACRTVRFDPPAPAGAIDMERSEGVLGFRSWGGSLFVFLDGSERHRIVLGGSSTSRERSSRLIEANCFVESVERHGEKWRLDVEGPSEGVVVLAGLEPRRSHVVTVFDQQGRQTVPEAAVWSGGDGALRCSVPLGGRRTIRVAPGAGVWWLVQLRRVALPAMMLLAVWLFVYRARRALGAAGRSL